MLPCAVPEYMGVPSKAIIKFIQRLEEYQIPMHSILIARYGRLITEAYYSPCDNHTLHRMFSVSKSFTSVAIGLMAEEGRLSLDDPIIQYFPDKLPEKVHPWIARLTIRDMLKMQTCHSAATYKSHPERDWVESFFTTKPSHPPGTVFNYDTSSSHTLCALAERLAGKPMLDYLRDRFLNQIGFSREAYMIKDPFGISMGGSGLMATSMDLLRFALAVMNGGTPDGKELLPKGYLKEALSHQTDTLLSGATLDERQGYGYQFWRIQKEGFACYGMGGQLAICIPKYDLICVTTADTQEIQGGNQLIYNSLYDEISPYLSEEALPPDIPAQTRLEDLVNHLSIRPLYGKAASPLTAEIQEKVYRLSANSSGFTSLSLRFHEKNSDGLLILSIGTQIQILPFGLGRMLTGRFPIYGQKCATSGTWLSEDTLYIKSHLIDECVGSVHFQLVFRDDGVTVYMKKIEETYFNEFTGYLYGQVKAD